MSAEANRRYRKRHPEELAEYKGEYRRRNEELLGDHTRSRLRWTKREDAAILDPGRPTDWRLSLRLGRTVQAIQTRRVHLKKALGRHL